MTPKAAPTGAALHAMNLTSAVLSVLLLIAVIAIIVLIYRFASLKARVPLIVQEDFELWRSRAEMEMQEKIRLRFEEWRQREVDAILATAQKDALLKAHDMFKSWTESELETIRREQREVATREATSQLIEWKNEQEKLIRQDAILRSQAVTLGKVTEHLVPYLPNFDYNPKDVRFIGSPVDFVIFDGLNEEEENQIRNVVFVEIKTGMSALSRRERLVRDAIRDGRVRWVEWHASNELRQERTGLFE